MTQKPTFELSIDTRILAELLAKADVGETVTYDAMSKELGNAVSGGSPVVQQALRHLESSDDMVFANVRGVGYQRLSDTEIVATGEHATSSLRRKARRAGKRLTKVQDFGALPRSDQIVHNARLSLFGAIGAMTKDKSFARLKSAVEGNEARELPIGRTLEIFKNGSPAREGSTQDE